MEEAVEQGTTVVTEGGTGVRVNLEPVLTTGVLDRGDGGKGHGGGGMGERRSK